MTAALVSRGHGNRFYVMDACVAAFTPVFVRLASFSWHSVSLLFFLNPKRPTRAGSLEL